MNTVQQVLFAGNVTIVHLTEYGEPGSAIKLPSASEIIKRLKRVFYNDAYILKWFYPLIKSITQEAGRQLCYQCIVMMLTAKFDGFVASDYPPSMTEVLHSYAPEFSDALIDARELAEQAKRFHRAVYS